VSRDRQGIPPGPGNSMPADQCGLCGRSGVETTVHHLLPKEHGGVSGPTVKLCKPCHKQLHALYTNVELAARLTSVEALLADEQIARYLKWIRKQAPGAIPRTRKSRAVRAKR
jgi:5-methylcytosine-specific restriction enzyme A